MWTTFATTTTTSTPLTTTFAVVGDVDFGNFGSIARARASPYARVVDVAFARDDGDDDDDDDEEEEEEEDVDDDDDDGDDDERDARASAYGEREMRRQRTRATRATRARRARTRARVVVLAPNFGNTRAVMNVEVCDGNRATSRSVVAGWTTDGGRRTEDETTEERRRRRSEDAFRRTLEVDIARDDDDEGEARARTIAAVALTRDGRAGTCAFKDGSARTYAEASGDGWREIRRARLAPSRESAYEDVHVSVGDDIEGSVAMAVGGTMAYVAHADGTSVAEALRHPARVVMTSWRHRSLVTLCLDGALRLWLHSLGNHGPMALTRTIQTPFGGLASIVAFDWLDADDTSDSLYDHALVGLDASSRIHVWTLTDIVSMHPLTTRRPDVTHRGSTTLERSIAPTFEDAPTVRASLRSLTDMRVLLASHRFGVIIARTKKENSDVLECLCSVSLGGHAARIVDTRRHPTHDVLATLDASGECKVWKRNTRGSIQLLDEISERLPKNCSAIAWGESADGRKAQLLLTIGEENNVASAYVDPETCSCIEVNDALALRDRALYARAIESRDALQSAIALKYARSGTMSNVELSEDGTRVAFFDDRGMLNVAAIVSATQLELALERFATPMTEFITKTGLRPMIRWFDFGAGDSALTVAAGTRLEVYVYAPSPRLHVYKDQSWKCIMVADVDEFVEDSQDGFISSIDWGHFGDVIYVTIGRSIFTIEGDSRERDIAKLAMQETAKLPTYHPSVLHDWLTRGKVARARMSVRSVIDYLRKEDFTKPYASLLPGELLAAATGDGASLAAADSSTVAPALPTPIAVPEFDMSAFGSFGGGMPSAAPRATFSFGADLESTSVAAISPSTKSTRGEKTRDIFSQREAEEATELLSTRGKHLRLTSAERMKFLGILDALRGIDDNSIAALDEAGRRFLVLWNTRSLRHHTEGHDPAIPSGQELCWVTQCETTDALLEAILSKESVDVSWSTLKRLGAPIWLRRDEDLRNLVDKCAKSEFARSKNVDDCALLFVISGRVKVLAGLYKATQNTRLYEFMCRDFSDERHREAALKNAYALLSKHRYAFAAVFFVLAGQALDAASLVWKYERDLPLALVIARLSHVADDAVKKHGGHLGASAVSLIRNDVIPETADPWLLAALSSLIGEYEQFLAQARILIDGNDADAADLLIFLSTAKKSTITDKAQIMASEACTALAISFEATGMPLAALERLANNAFAVNTLTKCRLAVGSILSEEICREVPDAELQVFTRDPWNLNLDIMKNMLHRRLEILSAGGCQVRRQVPRESKSQSSRTLHAKSPSLLPSEVLTVKIPRVPSGQDLKGEGSDKINLARNAFSKLRTIRVKAKRQKNAGSLDGPESPPTPSTPEYNSENVAREDFSLGDRCLRSPVVVATLQNDGFYDLCFNHEVPYELGCASVRQGLSIVNLRQLNSAEEESRKDAWAVLLRAQPPISGFKSTMTSWLNTDEAIPASGPLPPQHAQVREHEWATHAGLDMTSLTGIIPQSSNDMVGRNRKVIRREPANDVVARSVAAHPTRSFLAVGTSVGGVQLWNFHGENADNASAVFSLGGKKATSSTGASTRALAWSPHGARLAACTSDGNVTLWLGDAPDVEPAASRMCGFKGCKTEDVLFLSTNVMAVATSGGSTSSGLKPECVALWDALQPFNSSPGVLRAHAGGCSTLAHFPSLTAPHGVPWPFLITGGCHGDIAAHDLRMLGGDGDSTVLWRSPDPLTNSVTSIATVHHERSPLIVAGDKSGEIRAYSAFDGTLRQRFPVAHEAQKFLTPRGGGALVTVGVSRILPIHDGVLSAGGDGSVKCFRLHHTMRTR